MNNSDSDKEREREAILKAQQRTIDHLLRSLNTIIHDLDTGVDTQLILHFALKVRRDITIP